MEIRNQVTGAGRQALGAGVKMTGQGDKLYGFTWDLGRPSIPLGRDSGS